MIFEQLFIEQKGRHKEIIGNIVKRMDTLLQSPESILINQYDEVEKDNVHLYLIAKGKCRIEVRDKFVERSETVKVRNLDKGDHFGEISMIY